jgi:hypothetical protein
MVGMRVRTIVHCVFCGKCDIDLAEDLDILMHDVYALDYLLQETLQ